MAVTRERTRFALGAVCLAAVLALLARGSSADTCDVDSKNPESMNCNTGTDGSGTGSYTTVFDSKTAYREPVASGLSYDFYDNSCPNYKSIVQQVVSETLQSNPLAGAGILRVMFHDCMVQGCDASILLTGSGSEQESLPNLNLRQAAFQLADAIKSQLEQACPNTVSCADVLSLGAVEAVRQMNGPTIYVPMGRRDSTTFADNQTVFDSLPSPIANVSVNFPLFSSWGFSYTDFVALSGAHTLGQAHCGSFTNRLRPAVDSDLDGYLANTLEQLCPQDKTDALYELDDTPTNFDNKYFKDVLKGEVLLSSDASMEFDSNTVYLVKEYARRQSHFESQFANSILKLTQLSVLTGSSGEIRQSCSCVNWS